MHLSLTDIFLSDILQSDKFDCKTRRACLVYGHNGELETHHVGFVKFHDALEAWRSKESKRPFTQRNIKKTLFTETS